MESKQERSCGDCKWYKGNDTDGCGLFVERYTNCGGFVDTTKDAIRKGALVLEVDKKEDKARTCIACGMEYLENSGHSCEALNEAFVTGRAVVKDGKLVSIDKQEPNLEGKGVRDVLVNLIYGYSDSEVADETLSNAESRIRAIIRKEVVEEFWQEICKLYWNGNVEVDDATVTVMELVDIRNKILAKGE